MGKIWTLAEKLVKATNLKAFHEDMSFYFQWVDEEKKAGLVADRKEPVYHQRPTLGLHLELPNFVSLAIRPDWEEGKFLLDADNKRRWLKGRWLREPGTLITDSITLELLGPGKLFTIRLTPISEKFPEGIRLSGCVNKDMKVNAQRLALIVATCDKLLKDPWEAFRDSAALAEVCCCCHKPLDVEESKSRGIGPDCIRYFPDYGQNVSLGQAAKKKTEWRSIDAPIDEVPDQGQQYELLDLSEVE